MITPLTSPNQTNSTWATTEAPNQPTKHTTLMPSGLGKNPRYDNNTTPDQQPTSSTTERTRPPASEDDQGETRIDIQSFGPTSRATTLPPPSPASDRTNSRRPTTRIDTTLEMGYDYPTERTFTTLPATGGGQRNASTTISAVEISTQPTMVFPPLPPVEERTESSPIVGMPQVLPPTCRSDADCAAPASKCITQRCLIPCTTTTLNNTTTTSNTVAGNCFQGTYKPITCTYCKYRGFGI